MGRIGITSSPIVKLEEVFSEEMLMFYQGDWIAFIEDQILAPASEEMNEKFFLSDQQQEIIESVRVNRNTSTVAGKGNGKTGVTAMIGLTFLTLYPEPKVVATAPSFPQLKSALWPEVALWYKRSNMAGMFEFTAERLYNRAEPENWWMEPRTSSNKEAMQGLHAKHQLIIADEGSGVPDDIFEAIITTNSKPETNRFLAIGNGTKTTGWFYDSHNKNRHLFNCLQYSGEDSPFVDQEYVDDLAYRYGREHDIFRVSVLGLFPKGDPDSFISLERAEAAKMRDVIPQHGDDIVLGVDVARFGDDSTVIFWRHGNKVYDPIAKGQTSVPDVVDMVLAKVAEIRVATGSEQRITVNVDVGNMGAGVVDYLKLETDANIEVIGCNFGGAGNGIYADEASMMWGHLERSIDFIDLPQDRVTIEEISSRTFELTTDQRTKISSKKVYKRKFKKSPDRADALVLCLYNKKPEKTILRNFDRFDITQVARSVDYIGRAEKFVSIFYHKDMTASIVFGGWDSYKFYITAEIETTGSIGEISSFVRACGNPIVIGNDPMFGKNGHDIKSQLLKVGVRVLQNRQYDEYGATQQLVQMFDQGRIVIADRCHELIGQCDGWNVQDSQSVLHSKFGMCYATLNIISKLRNKMNTGHTQSNYIESVGYSHEQPQAQRPKDNPWLFV